MRIQHVFFAQDGFEYIRGRLVEKRIFRTGKVGVKKLQCSFWMDNVLDERKGAPQTCILGIGGAATDVSCFAGMRVRLFAMLVVGTV